MISQTGHLLDLLPVSHAGVHAIYYVGGARGIGLSRPPRASRRVEDVAGRALRVAELHAAHLAVLCRGLGWHNQSLGEGQPRPRRLRLLEAVQRPLRRQPRGGLGRGHRERGRPRPGRPHAPELRAGL